VFGTQAVVLDGVMSAQAFTGLKQAAAGLAPSGTALGGNFVPEGGSFILGAAFATNGINNGSSGELGSVIIQGEAPQLANLAPDFGATTPLNTTALNALGSNDPNNILAWTTVPAVPLSTGGFANVSVTVNNEVGQIVVAADTTLAVQPGGSITLKAPGTVSVLGDLIAPAGTISIAYDAKGFRRRRATSLSGPTRRSASPANGSTTAAQCRYRRRRQFHQWRQHHPVDGGFRRKQYRYHRFDHPAAGSVLNLASGGCCCRPARS